GRASPGSTRNRGRGRRRSSRSTSPSCRHSPKSSSRSNSPSERSRPPMRSLIRACIAIAACAGGIAACSDLTTLKQDAPSLIEAGKLDGPESEPLLLNSVIGDFECAYASEILATGLLSDELANTNTDGQSKDYD